MPHELAGALQQAARVRQRGTLKKTHVDVRSEHIDITEGRISQTRNRTTVMQEFPHFVSAFSHRLKPLSRHGSQLARMLFQPRINRRISLNRTVESQQLCSHRRSYFLLTVAPASLFL
jgi:hypothetical protein